MIASGRARSTLAASTAVVTSVLLLAGGHGPGRALAWGAVAVVAALVAAGGRVKGAANAWLTRLAWLAAGLGVLLAALSGIAALVAAAPATATTSTALSLLLLLTLVYVAAEARAPAAAVGGASATTRASRAALVTTIVLLFQMLLGGLVRGTGSSVACLDFPLCGAGLWPSGAGAVEAHVVHRLGAVVVAIFVLGTGIISFRATHGRPGLRALALAAPVTAALQIVLGLRIVQSLFMTSGGPPAEAHRAAGVGLLALEWITFLALAPSAAPTTEARPLASWTADLVRLTKPRITGLVVATFGGALWLAPGTLETGRVLLALAGTVLIVGAANALNMYYERDADALMARTRHRPLPAGRMAPEVALALGAALAAAAVPLLLVGANLLTAYLGLLAFVLYVWAYTPLKRRSSLALFVGAIPGALPPLMGWTTATGRLDAGGLSLFAILFFWQVPHFLAIALFRAEDYEQAGFRVMPQTMGQRATRLFIVGFSVALVGATWLPITFGVAGWPYAGMALLLGAIFVGWSFAGFRATAPGAWARSLFLASIVYLTLLFLGLGIDRHLR